MIEISEPHNRKSLAMANEIGKCIICGTEVPYTLTGGRLRLHPNNRSPYSGGYVNGSDDVNYICSSTCNKQALLQERLPIEKVLGDVVPSRFVNNKYSNLKAWGNE